MSETGVIHDIGYQRYRGPRLGRGYAARSLYLHSLRTAFGLGRSAKAKVFPWLIVGIVLAGAAGTAMCADLGARIVREEVAALRVLGVDPIKNVVLPRALALIAAALLLEMVSLCSGVPCAS